MDPIGVIAASLTPSASETSWKGVHVLTNKLVFGGSLVDHQRYPKTSNKDLPTCSVPLTARIIVYCHTRRRKRGGISSLRDGPLTGKVSLTQFTIYRYALAVWRAQPLVLSDLLLSFRRHRHVRPNLRAEGILPPRTRAATVVRVAYRATLERMASAVTVGPEDDA